MNNKLIHLYENALDFDKAIEDPKNFKNFNNNFVEKNIYALSETKEPELFHCILKMMNGYPDKYFHKSDDYLTWKELDQITIILSKNKNGILYSYFKDFNPTNGDFSIIFEYLKHITNISDYGFDGCENLNKIIIPKSITKLSNSCFNNCINLTEIILPKTITEIGKYCFCNCINLTKITIPRTVTKIDINCFDGCENLIKVIIPDSVTEIGYRCFNWCIKLKEIIIPDSVTKIGYFCFYNCKNLKKMIIPKKFKYNISDLFYNVDLSKVKITYI